MLRRTAPRLALLASLAFGLVACAGEKPTEEQCEAFAEHFVELLAESKGKPDARIRNLAKNQHQQIKDACAKEGTAKEVECVLAQTSLADVEANCK